MGSTYILEIEIAKFVGGLIVGMKEKEVSKMHVNNVYAPGTNHWVHAEIINTGRKPYWRKLSKI